MKFKVFVALCNNLEFDHPHCGEFDGVVCDGFEMTFSEQKPRLLHVNEHGDIDRTMPDNSVIIGSR